MTQDARDHGLLGHGGNDPERAASAPGTGGQSQIKHASQQSCSAPARCPWPGCMPIYTLLARCRDDRVPQLAMRCQTASIADEMGTQSSNGDNVMPVVPSDHGREKV